jgi:hypothetical protein
MSFGYHELERAALAFALEDETWPVFLEWLREKHISAGAHQWLLMNPQVDDYRRLWLTHSPIESLQDLASAWPEDHGKEWPAWPHPGIDT